MISALLLLVLAPSASIEGSVRAEGTREPIRHAAVQVVELNRHVAVDERGAFVVPGVPAGRWRLRASALGFQPFAVTVHVPAEGTVRLDLELSPAPVPLSRLEVRGRAEAADGPEAERARFDAAVQPAVTSLSRAQIRALPATAEPDVLRAAQALPGVAALNDLNAQLHVRGGAPDQNLFLVDGARVFAPYHLLGVAGAFNSDAVERMELHRGALPARHGGTLSAVVDVRQRAEGERLGAEGGIGSLSGRAAAHGPLGGAGGWMLAVRSSRARVGGFRYLDADHPHTFHDVHARIAAHPGRGHRLHASAFASADELGLRAPGGSLDLRAAWRNAAASLGWEMERGAWTVAASGWGSGYAGDLSVGVLQDAGGAPAPMDNRVTAGGGRVEAAGPGVRAGAEVERGNLGLKGRDLQGGYLIGESRRSYTLAAAYVEADRRMGPVRLAPGIRVARMHPSGRVLVEPRLAARVALAPDLALTVGAGRAHQHLSTLRDDRQALPGTAFWFAHPDTLSRGDGVNASLEGWMGRAWSFTAGGYARRFQDVVRWMPVGRREVGQVTRDDGRAAGVELSLRRHAGPVTGWIGYGWSRARMHDRTRRARRGRRVGPPPRPRRGRLPSAKALAGALRARHVRVGDAVLAVDRQHRRGAAGPAAWADRRQRGGARVRGPADALSGVLPAGRGRPRHGSAVGRRAGARAGAAQRDPPGQRALLPRRDARGRRRHPAPGAGSRAPVPLGHGGDRGRGGAAVRRWMTGLAALALMAACDDPSAVVEPPVVRALSLFMIMAPDEPQQALVVTGVQGEAVGAPVVEVLMDDQLVLRSQSRGSRWTCEARYGSVVPRNAACLVFSLAWAPGFPYTVRVSAAGYDTATATLQAPGEFHILSASAAGSPPGTAGLSASWTHSMGVSRYVVALRSDSLRACWMRGTCAEGAWNAQGWMAVTADSAIHAVVPPAEVRGGTGGWRLEVYAMNEALFDYLTTGSGTDPFPVPPAQNVRGGYGVVGAWVRRSVPLP